MLHYLCPRKRESYGVSELAFMVDIVQLVRASDCGSECRGFESHYPPQTIRSLFDKPA